MIDFSLYPEQAPFITPDNDIADPGYPVAVFDEAPFEEKRNMYINHLDLNTDELLMYLERGCSGYAANSNTSYLSKYNSAQAWIELLSARPSRLFWREEPKASSGNCLGTDLVYDFYRKFPEFTSRIYALNTYEEKYTDMLPAIYDVADSVFNTIGTRGQLYGYLDQEVNDIIERMQLDISAMKAVGDSWTDILNVAGAAWASFDSAFTDFNDNVLQAGNDLRLIIEPLVSYINLVEIGSNINTNTWGSLNSDDTISQSVYEYGRKTYAFTEDYVIEAGGISAQMLENMTQYIKGDRSNFELILVKTIKLAFDELQIRDQLIQVEGTIVTPTY